MGVICPICGKHLRGGLPQLAIHLKVHGYRPRSPPTRRRRKYMPKTARHDVAVFIHDYLSGSQQA